MKSQAYRRNKEDSQIELGEMKSMLSDLKLILDEINGILVIAKQKIGDLKDIIIKNYTK